MKRFVSEREVAGACIHTFLGTQRRKGGGGGLSKCKAIGGKTKGGLLISSMEVRSCEWKLWSQHSDRRLRDGFEGGRVKSGNHRGAASISSGVGLAGVKKGRGRRER